MPSRRFIGIDFFLAIGILVPDHFIKRKLVFEPFHGITTSVDKLQVLAGAYAADNFGDEDLFGLGFVDDAGGELNGGAE